MSAYADLKRLVDEPDPVLVLVRQHREADNLLNTPGEISDDEAPVHHENVIAPLEQQLMETRPTTMEGVVAILDFAAEVACGPTERGDFVAAMIKSAADAVRAERPVNPVASDEPDPVINLSEPNFYLR